MHSRPPVDTREQHSVTEGSPLFLKDDVTLRIEAAGLAG